MAPATAPILPGSTVTVADVTSIYNGYNGFVQRISGDRAAVLFEGGNTGQIGDPALEGPPAGLAQWMLTAACDKAAVHGA